MFTFPRTPAAYLAGTLAEMRAAVAARTVRPGHPGLPGWLILLIWTRLGRIAQRLARIFAQLEAGTLKPPRKRPATPRKPVARPPQPAADRKLPRGVAWLVPLVPGISFGRERLEALFAEPEMQAMLAAAPQLGRSLRPLCHMLGLRPLPPLLRLPAKPEPAPSDPAAAAKAGRTPPADPARARPPRTPRTPPPALEVARPVGVPPALASAFGR